MPARLPQPDFAKLSASLKEVVSQVEHVPNIPTPDLHKIMDGLKAVTIKSII
jgi:hypothetical protein